jgi:hypothetical protein
MVGSATSGERAALDATADNRGDDDEPRRLAWRHEKKRDA